jgi:hypothetical protein
MKTIRIKIIRNKIIDIYNNRFRYIIIIYNKFLPVSSSFFFQILNIFESSTLFSPVDSFNFKRLYNSPNNINNNNNNK